jgi:hypothetical protein
MSLCILIGIAVGCWALLSVVSGECLRQREAAEAEVRARELALADGEEQAG